MTLCRSQFLLLIGLLSMGPIVPESLHNAIPSNEYKRTITIHPSLPAYTFRFVINPGFNKVGAKGAVSRIDITRAGDSTICQTLKGFTTYHPFSEYDVEVKDLNFDGYQDLLLMYDNGSGGSWSHVWLFNPRTAKFDYNAQLSEFGSLEPDSAKHSLRSVSQNGACCGEETILGFERGKLVRLSVQTMQELDNREVFVRTIKFFQHNKLAATKVDTLSEPSWAK